MLTPETTIYLFMLVIYVIILTIFERARRKFKGGNIEMVIRLIIANAMFMLIADFSHFLVFLGPTIPHIFSTVFRLAAMCAIAFGGIRLIAA